MGLSDESQDKNNSPISLGTEENSWFKSNCNMVFSVSSLIAYLFKSSLFKRSIFSL